MQPWSQVHRLLSVEWLERPVSAPINQDLTDEVASKGEGCCCACELGACRLGVVQNLA